MQSYDFSLTCSECSGGLLDAGDELVCPSCGVVRAKEVIEDRRSSAPKAIDFTGQALGGYFGPMEPGGRDHLPSGLFTSNSSYDYLKLLSDYAGREDGPIYSCAKMIERVSEKLCLPNAVMIQAVTTAKKLLAAGVRGRRVTLGAVSAFSILAACRIGSGPPVSVHEVVSAHSEMGRRVTFSSLIQLSLSSPIKTLPRRPQEYIARAVARLAMDESLDRCLEREGANKNIYFNTLRETAKEILESVDENLKEGRRPGALAATAIYAAELLLAKVESRRRRITQRQVAKCGDTAEYTVREQYQGIFMPSRLRIRSGVPQTLPAPRSS